MGTNGTKLYQIQLFPWGDRQTPEPFILNQANKTMNKMEALRRGIPGSRQSGDTVSLIAKEQ